MRLRFLSDRALLVVLVAAAMLPFLDMRTLRMAGDEKVYLSQSVEMARGGRWFVQTLADEPSYFKGPLHYILVRIGMLVFGNRLIAGTWMNFAFAASAGLALYAVGRRKWGGKSGFLLGVAMALNVGVFSHALVSQMEVELCAFFAAATAALALAPQDKGAFRRDAVFWVVAGMAGWVKSPVYSALLGASGILYWGLNRGELLARARQPGSWAALLTGIAVGVAGYVPAFVLDHENFVNTFLLREQFVKGNNNRAWHYVMTPLLYFTLPWSFAIAGALCREMWFLVRGTPKRDTGLRDRSLVLLGAAIAAPSVVMWTTWSYKGQNYTLPIMAGLLVLTWASFGGKLPRLSLKASGALGALAFCAAAGLVTHFLPLPAWWGRGWLTAAFAAMALFAGLFFLGRSERAIGVGTAALFVAFGAFVTPLGEREMTDARRFLKENPGATIHYYNLDPSIWSEWSILQLELHHPVYGLHRTGQLAQAVSAGHAVMVQNRESLKTVTDFWKGLGKGSSAPSVIPWSRWLTKGKTPDGESRWMAAWRSRDLGMLERNFFIVLFP